MVCVVVSDCRLVMSVSSTCIANRNNGCIPWLVDQYRAKRRIAKNGFETSGTPRHKFDSLHTT